jgi:hypothetical protein
MGLQPERQLSTGPTEELQYEHNTTALAFLVPSLISILWWHESAILVQTLLVLGLILYGLDMVNARDAMAAMTWVSAFIMTIVCGFATFFQVDELDAKGIAMLFYVLVLAVEGIFFCTLVSFR